jgi:outer membrane protein TolC
MKRIISAVAITACVAGVASSAPVLDLDQYLAQVKEHNEAVTGAVLMSHGAAARAEESSLLFAPRFFADAFMLDDRRETTMPASQGTETEMVKAVAGIAAVTRFGLSGRLYYGISDISIADVNRLYIQRPAYTDANLTLELSQPLGQNRGGSQYKNSARAGSAQARAGHYAKQYEVQMLLCGAEITYWTLAAAQESVKILTLNLEKTRQILAFNTTKASRGLAEASDALQAEAMVRARTLDLLRAQSEEKEAARNLNAARNSDLEQATELIPPVDLDEVLRRLSVLPQRAAMRTDVKAAEQAVQATTAASALGADKLRPDVSLYTMASINTRGDTPVDAVENSLETDHPYYTIGIKLSVPMDTRTSRAVQKGYAQEADGALLQYRQKIRNQNTEWQTLISRMQDIRERLIAANELERAQHTKLEHERERQKAGRSTMFQVFAFEQDYLAAQLNLVNLRTTALVLLAQVKTFRDAEAY